MSKILTIGVLGGMGPEATNQLCALITANTSASRDQDHIPVITYNNARIPERVAAVRGVAGARDPVPEMSRTAQVLERAGADLLLMPCNLAHFFIADVQAAVRIPILNMIEETVNYTVGKFPQCRRVGLLASTPTIECGIYERAFGKHDRQLLVPDAREQEDKVMKAIYGSEGIKGGRKTVPRKLLQDAAERLAERGAEVVIAGCTEVSLVLTPENTSLEVIDPLAIIARVAVARARPNAGGE
ncbi:MAG TPA: amino acid racemase [Pyrinomonadaceae bacterium]|jgi:aspartate racemase|nr:amino acid racemase [Pyrinomonadaceae bacterium]